MKKKTRVFGSIQTHINDILTLLLHNIVNRIFHRGVHITVSKSNDVDLRNMCYFPFNSRRRFKKLRVIKTEIYR